MSDAQIWLSSVLTKDQKIVELRPTTLDRGKREKPPAAIPADAAEF
jgi:hypothetical protein